MALDPRSGLLALTTLSFCLAGVTAARTLYVATTGSDGGNTCNDDVTPCLTIKHAVQAASSGDTILIKGTGTPYNMDAITFDKDLTLDKWDTSPDLRCGQLGRECTSYVDGAEVTFGDLTISSCWFCFNDSQITSAGTSYADSKITIDVKKDASFTASKATFHETALSISNSCAPKSNQTCSSSSLKMRVADSSFIGKDSTISCSGNITQMKIDISDTTFDSIGDGVSFSNFYDIEFNAENMKVQNMLSMDYGFTIAGDVGSTLDIAMSGITVTNNTGYDGGALHIFTKLPKQVNIDIAGATFENNVGELAGAALYMDLYPGDVTQKALLRDSFFYNNHDSESAAGIFLTGGNLTVSNVNFTNNHVTTIASRLGSTPARKGAGGAINFLKASHLTLERCRFSNNTANWFGGAVAGSGTVLIANSYFENSDRGVHSTIGDMIFLMGPARVANITCHVNTTEDNLAVFWYSSEFDLTSLNDGYFNFTCPEGSQFRNESLPALVNDTVYAFKDLFYYCDPCPDGQYSLQHGFRYGSIELHKGNWSSDFQCHACTHGAECRRGRIRSKINFWGYPRGEPATVSLLPCPDGYCCDEAVCPSYDTCAPGRVGTLCGECAAGTSEILFSTECREDSECTDSWYMAIDVVSACTGTLFFLYQIEIAVWVTKYLFWQDVTPSDDPSMAGYIKTIFYFYQTIDLLNVQANEAEAKIGVAIQPFVSYLLTFRPLAAIFGVCPFPGLNPVTKNLLSTLQIIYMFAMVGILLLVHYIWERYSRHRPSDQGYCCVSQEEQLVTTPESSQHTRSTGFKARLATTCVSMFQYNYITIANVCFILLACVPIGDVSVLYFDGNVECLQPWQGAIIVIVIIHIVPFFVVVIVSRQLLEQDKITLTAFFVSYFLPLPMLLFWLVIWLQCKYKSRRDSIDMGIEETTLIENRNVENKEIKDQILFVVEEPFIKPNDVENSAKYWEGILIFRRLVLALLAVFVVDTLLALTLQTMMCLAFLLWHLHIKPYGSSSANHFETTSLTVLTAIGICHLIQATLFSAGKLPEGPTQTQIYVTDWIELILVNLFPAILVLLLVIAIVIRLGYVIYLFFAWLIEKYR